MAVQQGSEDIEKQLQPSNNQKASQSAGVTASAKSDTVSSGSNTDPDETVLFLEAKVKMLRSNLATALQDLDEAAGLKHDLEQLRIQLSAASMDPQTEQAAHATGQQSVGPSQLSSQSGQTSSRQGDKQPEQTKEQLQAQVKLLSEQLEDSNQNLVQAESTINGLRAAMGSKLAVSDQRQIQIETRVAQLQQQLQRHSIPAEAEMAAVTSKCESLQADNDKLQQQVADLKAQLATTSQQVGSKGQTDTQSAQVD